MLGKDFEAVFISRLKNKGKDAHDEYTEYYSKSESIKISKRTKI